MKIIKVLGIDDLLSYINKYKLKLDKEFLNGLNKQYNNIKYISKLFQKAMVKVFKKTWQ